MRIMFATLLLLVMSQSAMAWGNGRPSECPKKYCGCYLSLKLFGRVIPKLNLAANWMAFPRSSPSHGRIAARKGHVMMLLHHVEGKNWIVLDPNSGGGLTRQHIRSIAGFKIVSPVMMAGL